jgi:lysine 2,3-aminomutase
MSSPTLRTGTQLAAAGLAAASDVEKIDAVGDRYSIAIPAGIKALINQNDPGDPIARQFVPSADELAVGADELEDPIGDQVHSPMRGLVHRYPDRVLFMPTMSCPVYCRYCFRRDRVGRAASAPSADDLNAAFDYIQKNSGIHEVILTGGDPLSLSDTRLRRIVQRLNDIAHLNNIRIHSRVPVSLPSRVTDGLVDALRSNIPVWMVLHCNHPRELTDNVADVCARLIQGGIPLLSQSVLLKGVNDNVEVLTALMRRLVRLGVKPYYLHHPDRARGTARFRVSLAEGRALVDALRGNVSGLCQPTYVIDIPGGLGKTPVGTDTVTPAGDSWKLRDFHGTSHEYRE